MTDFGRVGRIRDGVTDATFMVVGQSASPDIRAGVNDYRIVINLSGVGYIGGDRMGDRVLPGDLAPIRIENDQIEWLDDPQP